MIFHLILLTVFETTQGAVNSSPNQKLRKLYRNTIEIVDQLNRTAVSKEEHQLTLAAAMENRKATNFFSQRLKHLTVI